MDGLGSEKRPDEREDSRGYGQEVVSGDLDGSGGPSASLPQPSPSRSRPATTDWPTVAIGFDHAPSPSRPSSTRASDPHTRSAAHPSEPAVHASSALARTDLHLVRPTAAPLSIGSVDGPDDFFTDQMDEDDELELAQEVEAVLEALSPPPRLDASTGVDDQRTLGLPSDPIRRPSRPLTATAPPALGPAPPPNAPLPTRAVSPWSSDRILRPDPADAATIEVLTRLHPEDLRSLAQALRSSHDSSAPPPPPLRLQAREGKGKRRRRGLNEAGKENDPARRRRRVALDDRPRQARRMAKRQATQGDGSGPSASGYPVCNNVGNSILSCFPQAGSNLVEGVWSKMIWNNNYPTFIGSVYVDIYLYNADSEQVVANWTRIENNRGMIGILPQDAWFPTETAWTQGQNVSTPYFFVITDAGSPITGAEQHQATFTVVQTAPPSTLVAASLSSVSSAAAASLSSALSSMSAAASSLSAAESSAGVSTGSNTASSGGQAGSGSGASGGGNPSSLQGDGDANSFPHWAIAVIVVLGVLALLALLVALYFVLVSARRKRELRSWSEGSRSPMMRNGENAALVGTSIGGSRRPESGSTRDMQDLQSPLSSRPGSPLSHADLGTAAAGGGAALGAVAATGGPSKRSSGHTDGSRDGPITSDDAERMADAFRNALRKPEFPPSSGDPTPEGSTPADGGPLAGVPPGIRQSMQAQLCDADKSSCEPSPKLDDSGHATSNE